MSRLRRPRDERNVLATRASRARTRNCGSTRNAAPRRAISSSQAAFEHQHRGHRPEAISPLAPPMNSPLAPCPVFVGLYLPFAKRCLGAHSLELQFALTVPVLLRPANHIFARTLLRLTPRVPLGHALLSCLGRRPVAFDSLDVALVHQQPLTEAVGASRAET